MRAAVIRTRFILWVKYSIDFRINFLDFCRNIFSQMGRKTLRSRKCNTAENVTAPEKHNTAKKRNAPERRHLPEKRNHPGKT